MLIVSIRNDATGSPEVGHYNVEVLITTSERHLHRLARARIENHPRANGWRALVRRVAEEAIDEGAIL